MISLPVPQPPGRLTDTKCAHVYCNNFLTVERVQFRAKTCSIICTKRAKASRQYNNRKLGINKTTEQLRVRVAELEAQVASCTCVEAI